MHTESVKKKMRPTYLKACWSCSAILEIEELEEELGIEWGDVEEYWVKWCVLHISMKDGTLHELSMEPGEVDWKRPYTVNVLDENYMPLFEEMYGNAGEE